MIRNSHSFVAFGQWTKYQFRSWLRSVNDSRTMETDYFHHYPPLNILIFIENTCKLENRKCVKNTQEKTAPETTKELRDEGQKITGEKEMN